jgi:hypothetical protein
VVFCVVNKPEHVQENGDRATGGLVMGAMRLLAMHIKKFGHDLKPGRGRISAALASPKNGGARLVSVGFLGDAKGCQ